MSSKASNHRLEKGKMQFVSTSVASSNQTNAANTGPQQELLQPSLSASFPVEHRYTRDQLLYLGGELPNSISNSIINAAVDSPSFHFDPSLFCIGHVPFDEGIENGSTSDISSADITNTTNFVFKEIPKLILSEKILNQIRKPWEKNALILNVLGERVGHRTFCYKVGDLWEFKKDFKVIELGYNFYIIWFESMDDYMKVFCGGPWTILGHYLGVRKWEPNFRAREAKEIATARTVQKHDNATSSIVSTAASHRQLLLPPIPFASRSDEIDFSGVPSKSPLATFSSVASATPPASAASSASLEHACTKKEGYSSLAIALVLPESGRLVACERDAICLEVAKQYYESMTELVFHTR
ncbi:hypothetical protein C3L33_18563, partial [Rhododendron williamsianum]